MSDSWLTAYVERGPRCRELFEQAKRNTAGGVGHDLRFSFPFPRYIDHAVGSRMWDADGNEYIDYGMGNAACLLGHSPPEVLNAVREVIGNGLHFGMDHPVQVEWAGLIQQLIPSAARVRFVNSGTEGSMLALRVARAFTRRTKVLRFEGHFSGWHDYVGKGAMPPFDESISAGIPPATLDTIVVIPADLDLVEETLPQRSRYRRRHAGAVRRVVGPSPFESRVQPRAASLDRGSWGAVDLRRSHHGLSVQSGRLSGTRGHHARHEHSG